MYYPKTPPRDRYATLADARDRLALSNPATGAQATSPYQTALSYVQQSRNDLAIPILEKLLGETPRDLKARNLLGIALLNSGRREEAAAQFRRAWELDASFYPALKNLAIAELALARRTEAREHFQQVLKLAPDDAVTHLNLAEIDFAAQRYADALAHNKRCGGLYLKDKEVALRVLRAAVESRNPAAAEGMAAQMDKAPEALRLLARSCEHAGDTQRAYDTLREASRIDPGDESVYLDLMSLCVEHRTWDLALQVAEAALDRLPKSFRVRIQRGAVFALMSEMDKAEREFAEAARLAPDEVVPAVSLALARVQLDRVPEALAGLRACRGAHPKDYLTARILGETLAQGGEETEAIQALEDAARLGPREAAPRLLLGKLLARRGELAGAAREMEAALKLQPGDTSAQYQLATIYRKSGDLKRADELFEKVGNARAEDPQNTAGRNLLEVIRQSGR